MRSAPRRSAACPSAKSLAALHGGRERCGRGRQGAAIRGLADWPDPAAMPDLLAIARTAQSQVHKVLALRGLIRLAALPKVRPPEATVKLLAEALSLARRAEEKKHGPGRVGRGPHPAGLGTGRGLPGRQGTGNRGGHGRREDRQEPAGTESGRGHRRGPEGPGRCAKSPAARQVAEGAMLSWPTWSTSPRRAWPAAPTA